MKFLNSNNRQSEESVWISNSDLMSGLMVIFLFISVAFVRQEAPATIGEENVSKNYLQGLLQLENQINIALEEEFTHEEKKKWKMEVLPDLNLVRFNTPDIMFEKSSPELSDDFKKILTEFFPRYIEILSRFGDSIEVVKIEGHTSSEWSGSSKEEAFIRNMFLSQQRTQAVFGHSMTMLLRKKNDRLANIALKKIQTSGMSSTDVIIDQKGEENFQLSRRVEFRHVFNDRAYLSKLREYLSVENNKFKLVKKGQSFENVEKQSEKEPKIDNNNSSTQTVLGVEMK
jgi:outer membrane protein OmpA-like peptidoglycan-associated protein